MLNFCQRPFIFWSCKDWLYGFCLVLICLTSGEVFWQFEVSQVPFLIFWVYHLIFCHFSSNSLSFLERIFIFFSCKDDFGYLGFILVCLTIGGGGSGGLLERFLRTCYHIFLRFTLNVITNVTIFLWEFFTVSNELLLLAHYYIDYCKAYSKQ